MRYEEMSPKMKEWNTKTIREEYEKAAEIQKQIEQLKEKQ